MAPLATVRQLVSVYIPYIWKTAGLTWRAPLVVTALSFLVICTDLLSIGLIVPFLQAFLGGGGVRSSAASSLDFLSPLFEGMEGVGAIRLLICLIMATTLMRVGLTYASTLSNFHFQIGVEKRIRQELFQRALNIDIGKLSQSRMSDLFFLINNQPNSVSYCLFTLVSFIPAICSLALFSVIVFVVSWRLTLVSGALFALSYLLLKSTTHKIRENSREHNIQAAGLYHVVMEALNGIQLVRAFVREDWVREKYAACLKTYVDVSRRGVVLKAKLLPIQSLASTFSLALILLIGTFFLTVDGKVWSEMVVLYLVVMARLSGPVNTLLRLRADIASQSHGVEQVASFLRENAPSCEQASQIPFPGLKDRLEFRSVSFRYPTSDSDVLRNVSFSLPRGKTIALVGSSGSGKSTIAKLLMRFHNPTDGFIACDGQPATGFDIAGWRRSIGVVSQSTFLFNETIKDNIRFGRLDATDDEIIEAALHANAHEFIIQTERGYDTLVGDRGVRLSGGQAQRIAIARAILANPPILILDEATSSLDAISEMHVQSAIGFLSRNRTVLVIAHRLSTIKSADNIIVLDEGRVVEQGTYDGLIANRGAFWDFARLQILADDPQPA